MSTTPEDSPRVPGPETARIDVSDGAVPVAQSRTTSALTDEELRLIEALRPGTALLLVPSGPSAGARYLLDQENTTVGRAAEQDILLDDVTVSRHHARFVAVGGGFQVVDSRSTNGTYLNGEPVEAAELAEGDVVQIGKFRLTFHPASAPAA
ncbi:FHA domain-containing protein [Kytococcus sp. Marseille-QA3725]